MGGLKSIPMATTQGNDPDRLSNAALEATEAGRFEEAERLCEKLRREYPELPDAHERLAMLREAQGRFQEAAEAYGALLDLMRRQPEGFDTEAIEFIEERRREALARA